MMSKKDIFIADAHIKDGESECANKLVRFIDHIKDSTRTLYILGDLFDFWFGGNRAYFDSYRPVLDKLIELKDAGVDLVYVEGNHEVFMGPFFTDTLKARVIEEDAFLEIDGKKIYLTHGDTIDHEDKAHLFSRRLLRSLPLHILMRIMPSSLIIPISSRISGTSRNYSAGKKDFRSELIDKHFNDKKDKGADYVIYAHTHKALIENRGDVYLLNPGTFIDGTYISYESGVFTIKSFS